MSSKKPILYSYWRSSCSWRVRIALALKGVEYDYRAVNLVKGEQLADSHTSTNPMHQVPTLEVSEGLISQSLPIIEYLDETYPQSPLLPRDNPFNKAKVRNLAEIISSGIQPIQNLGVLKHLASIAGDEQKAPWAKHFITLGFVALEQALQNTAGKYCFGDDVTLPDLCLVPQVYNANRFSVDMSQFATISRVHENLASHPAVIASHPDNMPDCPNK